MLIALLLAVPASAVGQPRAAVDARAGGAALVDTLPPPARGGPARGPDRGGQALQPPIAHLREWICIHLGEAAWNADTGNGYHGGLQMDWNFMRAYGADMLVKYHGPAERWSPRDQMIVAERGWLARGFQPWPNTARACGLL